MARDNDYLFTGGVAKVLECSSDNVRYLERTGQLSAERINGVRLFRRSDVERLQGERKARRGNEHPTSRRSLA
jgi:DNA-binding transcriptional MerR regulator